MCKLIATILLCMAPACYIEPAPTRFDFCAQALDEAAFDWRQVDLSTGSRSCLPQTWAGCCEYIGYGHAAATCLGAFLPPNTCEAFVCPDYVVEGCWWINE